MYRHTVGKAIGDKAAFDKFIHGLFFNNLIVVDDKCTSEFFRTVHHFHETVRRHMACVCDCQNNISIICAGGDRCSTAVNGHGHKLSVRCMNLCAFMYDELIEGCCFFQYPYVRDFFFSHKNILLL